jgi:DNA modification methylase
MEPYYEHTNTKLYLGDCLDIMPQLPNKSIDMILCDLPYGTTACKWDVLIPFELMWKEYGRIIKDNGAILLFGTEPFSSTLRLSNLSLFKYDWIWHKSKCGSAFTSKYRPQQKHENISVFGKGVLKYNPQLRDGEPYYRKRQPNKEGLKPNNHKLGVISESETINNGFRYPETVIYFQQKWRRQDQLHPTQKPIELFEYLIRTYTHIGDTVLDNCIGSGTTAVACKNIGRKCIGIELSKSYLDTSVIRLSAISTPMGLGI